MKRLPGPDRTVLYRLAPGTGFRANELRSLIPRSFRLDAEPPTVTVVAAYSKHRREDVQPIRRDQAEALLPWLAPKVPGNPAFGALSSKTNLMIRVGLEAAEIPYRDADGRVADCHSLRHSFVSSLARSNAPIKVIQDLARHSTPTLTLGIYAHVGIQDQAAALDALPPVGQPVAVPGVPSPSGGADLALTIALQRVRSPACWCRNLRSGSPARKPKARAHRGHRRDIEFEKYAPRATRPGRGRGRGVRDCPRISGIQ